MVARASQQPVEPEIEPSAGFDPPESREEMREQLEQGHALVRIQNGVLQRIAVERPRVDAKVLKAVLSELELAPELAAKNYYSIPYKQRVDGQERTVYVEGPSVRAMENIARRWGNCDVSSGILEVREDDATLMGVFLDYETGYRRTAQVRVSRMKHKRGGGTYTLAQDKWALELAKGCAIAARNATQQALPHWLVKRFFDKCKSLAAEREKKGGKVPTWATILAGFSQWGVTAEQLEALVGHALDDTTHFATDEELSQLRGIKNALEDGELGVADFFPTAEKAERKTSPVEDVLAGGAAITGGTVLQGRAAPAQTVTASTAETESSSAGAAQQSGVPGRGEGEKGSSPDSDPAFPATKQGLWSACVARAEKLGVDAMKRADVAAMILDGILQKRGVDRSDQLTAELMPKAIADAMNAKLPS